MGFDGSPYVKTERSSFLSIRSGLLCLAGFCYGKHRAKPSSGRAQTKHEPSAKPSSPPAGPTIQKSVASCHPCLRSFPRPRPRSLRELDEIGHSCTFRPVLKIVRLIINDLQQHPVQKSKTKLPRPPAAVDCSLPPTDY